MEERQISGSSRIHHLTLFWRGITAALSETWNTLGRQECTVTSRYRYTNKGLFHTSAVLFTLLICTRVGTLLQGQDLNDWSLARMSGSLLIAPEPACSLCYTLPMALTKLFTLGLWLTPLLQRSGFFLMNYLEHCDGANDLCVAGMESLHGRAHVGFSFNFHQNISVWGKRRHQLNAKDFLSSG